MNKLNGLLIRHVDWEAQTAGPSPNDNKRIELFLLGCKRAMEGNPCPGCFNRSAWDDSVATIDHNPIEVAEHINKFKKQYGNYITIGGGEPIDQIDNLIILCEELKKYDFHIIVYTWRRLKMMLSKPPICTIGTNFDGHKASDYLSHEYIGTYNIVKLLKYVDIIIDGEYKQEERLWDGEKADGFISSIGSGNQIIWDIPNNIGYSMRDVEELSLDENNKLIYKLKLGVKNKHMLIASQI